MKNDIIILFNPEEYQVIVSQHYNPADKPIPVTDTIGQRWVCNGKSLIRNCRTIMITYNFLVNHNAIVNKYFADVNKGYKECFEKWSAENIPETWKGYPV